MDDLEKQLQSALQREDAPEWFEARVMNEVKASARAREVQRARPRWHWMLATAMAGVIAVGGGWEYRREAQERAAGQAAAAKLQLALKITGTKLAEIQQKMNEGQAND
jgi:hypothetical protein